MKRKLLIVSPYFPPDNTADMHRVRMSLAYYAEFGWEARVLAVAPERTEAYKDTSLLETLPAGLEVYRVSALSPALTRKVGLGSIALRSLPTLFRKGNEIIRSWKPDLVFISTTQFPSMILGAWWKKKFGLPYVLDFQDPWHHDHYLKLPPNQRPPKFWFSYRLNQFLEPKALRRADGLMAVNQAYLDTLQERYFTRRSIPMRVIPFGASPADLSPKFQHLIPDFFPPSESGVLRWVYTGVVNQEMIPVIRLYFQAFARLRQEGTPGAEQVRFYFIGTSYGSGTYRKFKLDQIIAEAGLSDCVTEIPERIPFLAALQIQKQADLLLLPGTTDRNYIASKLAPYLLSGSPILSVFHSGSEAGPKLKEQPRVVALTFDQAELLETLTAPLADKMREMLTGAGQLREMPVRNSELYDARMLTGQQAELFNTVLTNPIQP